MAASCGCVCWGALVFGVWHLEKARAVKRDDELAFGLFSCGA